MPKYYIEVPYTGKLKVEIEANSKDEAVEMIFTTPVEDLEKMDQVAYVEREEEYHEKVVEGNVYYGVLNRLYVEAINEDED